MANISVGSLENSDVDHITIHSTNDSLNFLSCHGIRSIETDWDPHTLILTVRDSEKEYKIYLHMEN